MAHGYRTLQQWNHWLSQQFLGKKLLETEFHVLSGLLERHFGKHALLIGVPGQHELLKASKMPCNTIVSPFISRDQHAGHIEGEFNELPILTGSVDLVLLPHTLEYVDNPRQLLAEACRIIKPEGLIVICGFNPYSAWGLRKSFTRAPVSPWTGNFIHTQKVKNWLRLAEFHMEKQTSFLYRPPINHQRLFNQLQFLEHMGSLCPLLGGVYMIAARAKVIPLTPIRLKWKQQLGGIRVSTTI